jgi:geranylgeranyl diphosphate synthase type II
MNVGQAFQIADDILNVEGDRELMGKETGSDAARHKITYPSLLGMEIAKEKLTQHIEAAVASLSGFNERAMPLILVARYVKERKS